MTAQRIALDSDKPTTLLTLTREIPAGGYLRIGAAIGGMTRAFRVAAARADATELPVVDHWDATTFGERFAWYGQTQSVAVLQTPQALPAGTDIELTLDVAEPTDATQPIRVGSLVKLQLRVVETPEAIPAEPASEYVQLQIAPGRAQRIEAHLKPDGRVIVTHFDRSGAPAGEGSQGCTLQADGQCIDAPLVGPAACQAVLPDPAAVERVVARNAAGMEATSNARPVTMDGTPMYFGEIHWHSDFSCDGSRDLGEALASARDELALDFAGSAEHMWASGKYREDPDLGVREQMSVARAFDQPGRFCTMPGFELSCRYGHANIYAESWDLLAELADGLSGEFAEQSKDQNRYPWRSLVDLCPPGRAVLAPHHPNMDSYVVEKVCREDGRAWWGPMDWPVEVDRDVIRLYEIVQNRGAFESEVPDLDWKTEFGGYGGSARTALARGYRMGFLGCTDNHCGWPTRNAHGYGGLTVVQAETLDTPSIFRALHDRRCYATSGARIVADATFNGLPMGSEVTGEPDKSRQFNIRIRGSAPLDRVEIISWNCVAGDIPVDRDSTDLDATWVDDRPGRPMSGVYYYIRIRQQDGHCAWLSPWWFDAV